MYELSETADGGRSAGGRSAGYQVLVEVLEEPQVLDLRAEQLRRHASLVPNRTLEASVAPPLKSIAHCRLRSAPLRLFACLFVSVVRRPACCALQRCEGLA